MKGLSNHRLLMLVCALLMLGSLGSIFYNLKQQQRIADLESRLADEQRPWSLFSSPDFDNLFNYPADPFDAMTQMDDLLAQLRQNRLGQYPLLKNDLARHSIEFEEKADRYEILIRVPEGETIEISHEVASDYITVTGQVKSQQQKREKGMALNTASSYQFSKTFSFMEPVAVERMESKEQDRLITLILPKA